MQPSWGEIWSAVFHAMSAFAFLVATIVVLAGNGNSDTTGRAVLASIGAGITLYVAAKIPPRRR